MAMAMTGEQLVGVLRETIGALVKRDGDDLSARQLAVFLNCYLKEGAHTVRGLSTDLEISKPAVTRAVDRLASFDLVARKPDPADRRSVLIARTPTGTAFVRELRSILRTAAAPKPAPRTRATASESRVTH